MSGADRPETSYDVKVWKITKYEGRQVTTHRVRWAVGGREQRKGFRSAAAADSFRADLVSAHRRGEPFDVASGLPAAAVKAEVPVVGWYTFACSYVDMKWPRISAKYRKGVAEALTTATAALLTEELAPDDAKRLRSALLNWGFNTRRRGSGEQPADVTERLAWVESHCRPVSDLARPEVLRRVLDALASRLDGKQAAGRTTHRKRAVLSNALSFAVEKGLLAGNPVGSIKWKAPKSSVAVEAQCVPNPTQARAFLAAVRTTPRSGERLYAFFACLYFSGLRPEEAVSLRKSDLDLPETGWGTIVLRVAAPDAGSAWTDDGAQRQRRQLKHRAVGETRTVPCPPELVAILGWHLERFGTDAEGRLFRGERGGELATVTYTRLWQRARTTALGEDVAADSPLARRPYDLRHAAVSTWLESGVSPKRIAEWAGHSPDVLLKIYAKVLDGHQDSALRRIEATLTGATTEEQPAATGGAQPPRRMPRPRLRRRRA